MLAAAAAGMAKNVVTVADRDDKTPLPGVSVISSNGLIIGVTDSLGRISVEQRDYPLSLRIAGYEQSTAASADNDSIFLTPASYTLQEVVVTPADRPIIRVVTYAREYCTGAVSRDTLQLYGEYMLEYFFADGKVKGYSKGHQQAHSLSAARYGRIVKADGTDSVMRPTEGEDITLLSMAQHFLSIPHKPLKLSERMLQGAMADTIAGKYSPKHIYRLDKNFLTAETDALADHKEHRFSPWFLKALGLTMDMLTATKTHTYARNATGAYDLSNFICETYNMQFVGKGRLLKKLLGIKEPIDINSYFEQYPVDIQYLTAEEYQELKKIYDERTEPIRRPAELLPLAPAVERLTDRIDRELRQ